MSDEYLVALRALEQDRNGDVPAREVATALLECENVSVMTHGMFDGAVPVWQQVDGRTFLSAMRDYAIENTKIPVSMIVSHVTATSMPNLTTDAYVLLLVMSYYCSIDADFLEIFFPMLRGMSSSMHIGAYLSMAGFITAIMTAYPQTKSLSLQQVYDHMVNAPGIGVYTPFEAVRHALDASDISVPASAPDYDAIMRMLAKHDGSFSVNGVSFETSESMPSVVPWKSSSFVMPDLSPDLTRALFTTVAVPCAPASTFSFLTNTFQHVDMRTNVRNTHKAADAIMSVVNAMGRMTIEKVHDSDKNVSTTTVSKTPSMQGAMIGALRCERDGDASSSPSIDMLRHCHEVMDMVTDEPNVPGFLVEVIRLVPTGNLDVEADRRLFGTYDLDQVHLMGALAPLDAISSFPNMIGGSVTVSAASLVATLLSLDCAVRSYVKEAMPDIISLLASMQLLDHRFSNDIDVKPQSISMDDAVNSISQTLGSVQVKREAMGKILSLPSVLLPTSLFALSYDQTNDISIPTDMKTLTDRFRDAYRSLDEDPFAIEGGIPNMMMRIIETIGNNMARSGTIRMMSRQGLSSDTISVFISMLGMMEFYACIVSHGGYASLVRDVGHIGSLIYDDVASVDVIGEVDRYVMSRKRSTYEVSEQVVEYDGRTNPFGDQKVDEPFDARWSPDPKHYPSSYGDVRSVMSQSTDLTDTVGNDGYRHAIGRKRLLDRIETILSNDGNIARNVPLVVGSHGSGRHDLVRGLASRIRNGECVDRLQNRHVCLVDVSTLNDAETSLNAIIDEASRHNIVLVIDDLMDVYAMSPLIPILHRAFDTVDVIAISDEAGYKYIKSHDTYTLERMVRIDVTPLDSEEVKQVLLQHRDGVAKSHKIDISDKTIGGIVTGMVASASSLPSPSRELEVLECVASITENDGRRFVTQSDIDEAIDTMGSVAPRRDSRLHADPFYDVAGQREPKHIVTERMKASSLGLFASDSPRNIFMFCGPSGCGKTMLANRIIRVTHGHADDVLTIPMSEYSTQWEGTRLVGSAPGYVGYENGGILTNFAQNHPRGVLILDEIEKAHPRIIEMFLNMFDSGWIDSAKGEHVDCRMLTIVCTSNAGFDEGTNAIGFYTGANRSYDEKVADVRKALVRRLGAPFVGRVPDVIVFDELRHDDLIEAMRINFDALADEYHRRLGVDVRDVISHNDIDAIAETQMTHANGDIGVRGLWKQVEHEVNDRLVKVMSETRNGS